MARAPKLGSSSCRPLLQGMMLLLAVLLLASIQAGPVMALAFDGQQAVAVADGVVKHGREAVNDMREAFLDHDGPKHMDHWSKKGLTASGNLNPAYRRFTDGAKKGITYHKYVCKAQGLMDKLNPEGGGGSVTPSFVPTLAGDMFRSFPALFSYSVKIPPGIVNVVTCWSNEQQVPAAGTGARITGILVGQEMVPVQMPAPAAYQSTAATYYNLARSLDGPLKKAVIPQVNALNRAMLKPFAPTADELCYATTVALPPIAVLLASDNGGMRTMELGVATDTPVWYQYHKSSMSMNCLGIQRTIELLILGS